ncbi:MAG: PIG-L family deacetylase [Planctomycetes bacterium]|nr:PIG-L family deacetylase [Planctomycetota bacterium]
MIRPLFAFLILLFPAAPTRAGGEGSAADLAVSLRKANTLGSVLYIAAHPDDENTSLLAYLARERCVRAAYLSVTRGDGGQNLIGSEKGPLMGLLRTQELLAARRIDAAEQWFTRAIDFGYSKNPEETLQIWGKDEVLGDMVWAIRNVRPDVIITRFPTNGDGGHGHHTASAILAGLAYTAAADATKYPEQLKYVKPWQAKRLCWNSWAGQFGTRNETAGLLPVDIGSYNSLLGKSYTEIAGASRSQHKSQGFGAPERRGSRMDNLQILAGEPAKNDFLEGIDLTWGRVAGSEAVAKLLAEAEQSYDFRAPEKIVPILLKAHEALSKLDATDPWVARKRGEILEIIREASGLWLEAVASAYSAAPGETVKISTTAIVRGNVPFELEPGEITYGGAVKAGGEALKRNEQARADINIKIAADAPFTEPYWLRDAPSEGLFTVRDLTKIGAPENGPAVSAKFIIHAGGAKLQYEIPVVYRWVDPVKGELTRPFIISPPLTAEWSEKVYLFSAGGSKKAGFKLKAGRASAAGAVKPVLPKGWSSKPAEFKFNLNKKDDEVEGAFEIAANAGEAAVPDSGELALNIQFDDGSLAQARSLVRVDYPHIPIQTLFPKASARLVRVDASVIGSNIGYIDGAGDDVAAALRQLGLNVQFLTDAELETADLKHFDAIVAGVRAYNTRPRLRYAQKRLMEYVENGGTYVVQYNTLGDMAVNEIGPFPFGISRDRVTVEGAPVRFIKKDHPLLTIPNPIGAADFESWVQERGLYFARMEPERPDDGNRPRFGPQGGAVTDKRYEAVLGMNDPGESEKTGSLIYAKHGKGIFIYTGLAFFRQLPAGVGGAYRLFANLVSARGEK